MKREFYDYPIRFDGKSGFLLWFTVADANEDLDGVVTDDNNRIPIFSNLDALKKWAEKREMAPLEFNPSVSLDLDYLQRWLPSRRSVFNCNEILDAWNLFSDVSRSISGNFNEPRGRTQKIYSKIFWGNNLPAVTPHHAHHRPHWSPLELALTRLTLRRGLEMFRKAAHFHEI